MPTRTHLEVQQREDTRRDLVERMNFVHPDLPAREIVFIEEPSKIQQRRKSGRWLQVEIIAIKGPMAVTRTVSTIFQTNISKSRRHLETMDPEELPDSREQTGAPVQRLSCAGQADVLEMFSDNSHLILIDKDFCLQHQ